MKEEDQYTARPFEQTKPISLLTYFIILSILFHILFLMSLSVVWVTPWIKEKPPSLEVPAYFYRDNALAGAAQSSSIKHKTEMSKKERGLEKEQLTRPTESSPPTQSQQAITVPTDEEPIHLIGDKNTPPKPLAKIIGRALTKKLTYPKIAVDFRLRGTVYVGFSLHPDGHLTEIKLVQSSRAGVLDEAALAAVQAITPLQNVAAYVNKPRYLVIGIIFR